MWAAVVATSAAVSHDIPCGGRATTSSIRATRFRWQIPGPATQSAKQDTGDDEVCGDTCTRATCTATATADAKGWGDPRCQTTVRPAASESLADSEGEVPDSSFARSYADTVADGCEKYTRSMNRVGRDRFIACVLATGMGFRVCLWNASVAPCGYGQEAGPPEGSRDFDLEE